MYVEPKANQELENEIAAISNPVEGQMVVSSACLMKTCAWYVGQICAEFIDGEWLWQPYDRLSSYTDYRYEAEMWRDEYLDFVKEWSEISNV